MLRRSQIQTMLMLSNWENENKEETTFYSLPIEVIHKIRDTNYVRDPNCDTAKFLHHIAYADLKTVEVMLDANPKLLLIASDVVTPAGLFIKRVKPYECALGALDIQMKELVESYFSNINDGEKERLEQYEPYRPLIEVRAGIIPDCLKELSTIIEKSSNKDITTALEKFKNEKGKKEYQGYKPWIDAMLQQKPDGLTSLFNIIMNSSADDVAKELATGDEYDQNYTSPLRNALNQFRAAKLDEKVRIITKPRMHCNDQNLIHAYEMLDLKWDDLYRASGGNYNKIDLIARQIIGFIQLLELPGFERCLFARGQVDEAAAGKEVGRSYFYKHGSGRFPDFDQSLVESHSGVGFDSYISIYGSRWLLTVGYAVDALHGVQNLYLAKTLNLQNLCSHSRDRKRLGG